MKKETAKETEDTFKEVLSKWNKMTRQEQEVLGETPPNNLTQEQIRWIDVLLKNTSTEKQVGFASCKSAVQKKQMKKLVNQVRNWIFKKKVDIILRNNPATSIKKEDKRLLLINKLWTERTEVEKNEILLKTWETLNASEMVWIPGLLQIVYRMSEKDWQKCDNKKRSRLISQLNVYIRQDRIAVITGKNLQKIRTSLANWNQSEVARMNGSNQSIISKIENGQNVDIHYYLDLMNLYSQYVSLQNIFSENFSIIRIPEESEDTKYITEQIMEQCRQMCTDGMNLMQSFLMNQSKNLSEIVQTNLEPLPTRESDNFKWFMTTIFTPEQIERMRQAVIEDELDTVE